MSPRKNYLPVEPYRKWLWEIYHRCDNNWHVVEKTTGLKVNNILRWVGHYRGRNSEYMQRESANQIVASLVGLRRGELEIQKINGTRGSAIRRVFRYGCKRCGTQRGQYNPDCQICQQRKRRTEAIIERESNLN